MKIKLSEKVEIPEKVEIKYEGGTLTVKGPKGESSKKIYHPQIKISINDKKVLLESENATKREKTLMYTFVAHATNMIKGVKNPYIYKLKMCSGPPTSHFPMQVNIVNNVFTIKNFLGEKVPRLLKLKPGVEVKISGTDIQVESVDLEKAGQTASEIELKTKTRNKDPRIFQDGIYITEKPS